MKKIILTMSLICFSQIVLAQPSQLISARVLNLASGGTDVAIAIGLLENGFQSPSALCYTGSAKDVCSLVQKEQFKILSDYSGGAHGRIEIEKCAVQPKDDMDYNEIVLLKYKQVTDYDTVEMQGKTLEFNIGRCAETF